MELVGRGYGVLKVIETGTTCHLESDHNGVQFFILLSGQMAPHPPL